MTVRQEQCLLCYLGYDTGGVDGVAGEKTVAARERFREEFGADDLKKAVAEGWSRPVDGEDFWKEVRFFRREEFRCQCGGKHCGGFPAEPERELVTAAEAVRGHFGKAVTVSSGVRCPKHNASVGGVANSRHLRGKAMDFCVAGQDAETVLAVVKQLKQVRYAYAIGHRYVHMDVN